MYTINDLCKEFAVDGKPKNRSTIHRWIKKGVIKKPDIGKGARPLWLTLPVKSQDNQSTKTSS